MREPELKRVIAFFDGQNLFNAVKEAFGYRFPNFDPQELAATLCRQKGWQLRQTRFYTGVPDPRDGDPREGFWERKLAQMGRQGVWTFSRPVRNGREKGVDVRIALDIVGCALDRECDVVLLFSQDQDLAEVGVELRKIARQSGRWIKIASAFPVSDASRNRRGINGTDWIVIDRLTYDGCIDPRDYRSS